MPDGLYDLDMSLWAERQAVLLRRLAAGERVNEQLDWAHLIEEVEDLGRSQLHACQSLLVQGMTHLLKLSLWPDSRDAPHWRSEAVTFLRQVARQYAPSMAQRLDIEALYLDALASVEELGANRASLAILRLAGPPYQAVDLVARQPDIDALLVRLVVSGSQPSP